MAGSEGSGRREPGQVPVRVLGTRLADLERMAESNEVNAEVLFDEEEDGRTDQATVRSPILIVEDDDELRDVLALALQSVGYEVTTVRNGWEALEFLRKGHVPAVILLDLMMPVMSGWEFCQAQQADPELAEIPVLVMSSVARMDPQSPFFADAIDAIRKPVSFEELLRKIRPFVGPVVAGSGSFN
jgi:CheY-like chemotaxis protein